MRTDFYNQNGTLTTYVPDLWVIKLQLEAQPTLDSTARQQLEALTVFFDEYNRAYEVGMLHGIGGRYDCRPFGNDYTLFSRYEQGQHDGIKHRIM